jgi:radical SAM superfamily enzyme YgiQ (UPF0313 family)
MGLKMPDVVLTTLNARYCHAALGLRYLQANLGVLQQTAQIVEFDISQRPMDVAERLLAINPVILGLGVYIWNATQSTELVRLLKRLRPGLIIVLGGPEVSYEWEDQEIVRLADSVITGEADLKFAQVCDEILAGQMPASKIIPAELPDCAKLRLPYDLYDEQDVAHRVIYVEASRGCPFDCEFCLSSLDIPVRQFNLDEFLGQMQRLLDRGAKRFKFVDRTFNLSAKTSASILAFFLERFQPGHFLHFEMVPDRLPEALRGLISKFPLGALQFEIGIQTFNEDVGRAIKRRQDPARIEENFKFLRAKTGVHIHADLIAGLPGESMESLAAGFDRLLRLKPQEIQVGILKRLRGTPIVRHDQEWGMVYSKTPPYEILENKLIDFNTMQRIRRFARYWDLFANSGNFIEALPLLWSVSSNHPAAQKARSESEAERRLQAAGGSPAEHSCLPPEGGVPVQGMSPFHEFMRFSDWLFARAGRTDSLALVVLMERLFEYLIQEKGRPRKELAETILEDYSRGGRRDIPGFLRPHVQVRATERLVTRGLRALPKRQRRHAAAAIKGEAAV